MGTLSYMSPEQVRGLEVDERTDIWSLGVVLYEMVTGRVPFTGETTNHIAVATLEKDPVPLSLIAPHAPSELQGIVRKSLTKDPDERYQTARDLLIDLKNLKQDLTSTVMHRPEIEAKVVPQEDQRRTSETRLPTRKSIFLRANKSALALTLIALLLATVGVAYVAYLMMNQRRVASKKPPQRSLSRLTFDAGLQSDPTWSPDGRLIAYSSDKSGNFDIWVQPVGGGDAAQVTHSPTNDWQPDWSPDGTQIVFRSERESGGLFVVPILGGRERKISSFGYHPRWSPDGTRILFSNWLYETYYPKLYLVTLDGNSPREVLSELLTDFSFLEFAVWHPDGQRISFWGERKSLGREFWTVSVTGGKPVRSDLDAEVAQLFKEQFLTDFNAANFRWAPSGRALYFNGISRGVSNLWRVTVDPQTLRWIGGPERLTTGLKDTDIALSPDGRRLAFTVRNESTRAWSLPFDSHAGRFVSEGQPVTPSGKLSAFINLSRAGKHLLFLTDLPGTQQWQLWDKSLADNHETLLTVADASYIANPCWSRDGSRIAYRKNHSESSRDEFYIVVQPAGGGDEQVIASGADDVIFDWSADGKSILATSDRESPRRWGVLALYPVSAAPHAEAQMRVITSHPAYNLFQARFSPDDRWVCFNALKPGNVSVIYCVSSSGGEWTRITEDNGSSDKPHWSPDGKAIYFLSNRGTGFFNVWGIRFDSEQGKPIGDPFRVTSFDSPGRMVWPLLGGSEIALSADRLVLPITEVTGNIWVLDGVDR
jgi:Tol biopolymer transport system component